MALSFAIDTSKGETFDSAQRKRAQAEALARSIMGGRSQNVGEGLSSVGRAILYRSLMGKADAAGKAGEASASDAMGSIFGGMAGFPAAPSAGGSGAVASSDPSVSPNANVGSTIDFARGERGHGGSPYRDAIASIESDGSGGYSAIGPTHKTLGRALGRYQVMEANIGPWSKAALGREVTADEFLADKGIQDTIFDHRFGGYVKKFGNPQDAASAWFTGRPLAEGANAKDVLGTTGAAYVDKFTKALPQGGVAPAPVQVASLDPSIGMPNAGPVPSEYSSMGLTPEAWAGMNAPDGAQPAPQPAPALPAPRMVPDMPIAATQPPQQVAQAPSPQDLSTLPVTAGGAAGALQPGQSSGPSLQQLLQAAQNPWLNDNQRQVVNMLLEQEMQKQDPMRQLEMQKLQRDLSAAPERKTTTINGRLVDTQTGQEIAEFPDQVKPTSDIQEYEYAKQQGYKGSFADFQQEMKRAGATNVTTNVGGENLTPGQKKIDEAFADTYLSWNAGGFADSIKQTEQLDEALKILESGENITGAIGLIPDQMAAFVNPNGTIAKNNVEEVVQRSLREILGAQFTEKEGERLIARAFNPLLSPPENAKRVRRLFGVIRDMAGAKQQMVDYFDQNGTLRGYKGSRPTASQLESVSREFDTKPAGPVKINGYTIEQVED